MCLNLCECCDLVLELPSLPYPIGSLLKLGQNDTGTKRIRAKVTHLIWPNRPIPKNIQKWCEATRPRFVKTCVQNGSRYCAWRQNLLHWDKKNTTTTNDLFFKIQFSQNIKRYVHFFYSVQAHVSYCPPYFWMLFFKIRFCSNISDLIIVLWIKDGSFNVDIKKLVNNSVIWWKFTW